MEVKESEKCFVIESDESIHSVGKTKYFEFSERLVRLNNYDHVTAELFTKLKTVLNDPNLSRFKKPAFKICLACCKHLQDLISDDEGRYKRKQNDHISKPETSATNDDSFDTLLKQVKAFPFTEEQLNILSNVVGGRMAPSANKYVAELNKSNLGNRLEHMAHFNYQSYWQTAYGPLKNILLGLIDGISKRSETVETRSSRIRFGVHAIETIFAAINLKYVSAKALSEMLYMYFLSNSRRVCEIYGATTGGGTSTTLHNALDKISKLPPKLPEEGYIVVAFDNNQVMAKAHRVELDCKYKVSVVTSIAAFELLDVENPQKTTMSFPLMYEMSPNEASDLYQKLQQFTTSSLKLVNEYLVKFLTKRLQYIESTVHDDGTDYVDESSKAAPKENQRSMIHDDISEMQSSCETYDQECLLINPNSYDSVRDVLLHIQKIALSEKRKWVTVVVDGVPFGLAQEIIRKSVYCHICDEVVLEKYISSHYKSSHNQPSPSQLKRVFSNILLRPGAGHYEMNMVKSLFSGWFPLYLEPVTELMGFHSPKAKLCVESCSDHHKAWQILEITFESLSDELLYSFVKSCRRNTPTCEPTVENFFQEVNNSPNENVKAAFQFAYYWCFSILLFRGGIRKNNFDVSIKAREQGSGLFYAFRHPKYQVINCQDVAELILMPADLREAVFRESMVIPGSKVGQGVDFLLEQRNKRMKNYVIRNGVPTSQQWKAASASMQSLDKIIDGVEERLHLQSADGEHRIDHSREKIAARTLFRNNSFFDFSKKAEVSLLPNVRHETKPFNSILRCQWLAEKNRKTFYEGLVKTGQTAVTSYISLFKKDDVEEEVNGWGITKLKSATKAILKYLSKDLQKEFQMELKSSDKEKLKETYWRVYNLVDNEDEEC